jgi:hypothetical protein
MLVVGLDVGLVHAAIAVVVGDNHCLWRASIKVEGDGTGPRYSVLREALEKSFAHVHETPRVIAIEEPELFIYKGRDAASILKLYGAFAVSFAEAERVWPDAKVIGVTPAQWKGTAKKKGTQGVLRSQYEIECGNEHEWDALGLADWAWNMAVDLEKKL